MNRWNSFCVLAVKFNEFPSKRTNGKEYCSFATWKCRNNGRICAFSSQFSLCAFFCALNAERNTKRWIIALAIALARRRNRKTQPTHRMKTHRERDRNKNMERQHTHTRKKNRWWNGESYNRRVVAIATETYTTDRRAHLISGRSFLVLQKRYDYAEYFWLHRSTPPFQT